VSENSNGSRRGFIKTAVLAAAAIAANDAGFPAIAKGASPMNLPPLPWADNALEPFISKNTIGFHYGKHHKTYFDNLTGLVAGKPEADMDLVAIVKGAAGKADKTAIFNNAAQVWNHTFYWHCLSPKGGGEAKGALAEAISRKFGSFSAFKEAFSKSAVGNFGSGWTWLVKKADGAVDIVNTSNAATPLTGADKPLLTCDVWEHAYYVDYRNRRPDYVAAFWNLVHWDFAAKNYAG
jgi:Fe-Mn family superoxide dismutase